MNGWKEVSVSDLGRVITGNTPPRKNPELYGNHTIFIKPTDISEGEKYTYSPEECYSELGFKKYKNSLIPKGATCVVTIGSIGKKMTKAHCDCFINQAVNAVVPNEFYDEEFVYYVLKYNLEQLKGVDSGTASGRENVSKSSFSRIKLNAPIDKPVQSKIGKVLCSYDDLIENNLKRIKLLEELAQRTYEEWFVNRRIDKMLLEEKDFEIFPLQQLVSDYMNGGWGKEVSEGNFTDEAFVLRGTDMPDISSGNFINLPLRFHLPKNLQSRELKNGDISIEMSNGNMISVGRSFLFDDVLAKKLGKPVMCASFCKMLRPISIEHSYIISNHLRYIHSSNDMFVYKSQGANGINNFRFEDMIKEELLFVPKGKFLEGLSGKLKSYAILISNLRIQIANLKEARDILLPRLMNGTISARVGETNPVTKTIQVEAPTQKQATPQFKEAILISLLTYKFGSEKYPLGRMRYTKLSYLFHRHADNQIKDYLRKAAGPYNPKTKYGGPEKIAHDNGYIADHKNGQLSGFIAGPNIEKAKPYFQSYWNMEYLNWLEAQFKYKSNDDLELFATVDNSLIELNKKDLPFTLEAVKKILQEESEWKAKLKREIFNDVNIQRAISYLPTIFEY